MSSLNTISYGIGVPFGSKDDPKYKEGLHHFSEHLIFESKRNKEFIEKMSIKGVAYNGSTSFDFILFYTQSLLEDNTLSQNFISGIFNDLTINEEEINKEKKLICKEIDFYLQQSFELLIANMIGNGHLCVPILGSKNTLNNITYEDICSTINKMKKNTILANSNEDVTLQVEENLHMTSINLEFKKEDEIFKSSIISIDCMDYAVRFIIDDGRDNLVKFIMESLQLLTKELRIKGIIYRAQTQQIKILDKVNLFYCVEINKKDFQKFKSIVNEYFKKLPQKISQLACLIRKNNKINLLKQDNPIGHMKINFYKKMREASTNEEYIDGVQKQVKVSTAILTS